VVEVIVERGNRIEVEKRDLVLLWWFRFMTAFPVSIAKAGSYSISFTDVTGTGRTQTILLGARSTEAFTTGCGDHYTYIGLGSGSTPASESDYKLESEITTIKADVVVNEPDYEVRASIAYTPTTDVTICEVGLYISVCDSGGILRRILVDRTVLEPCITVTAGSTISVLYKVKA